MELNMNLNLKVVALNISNHPSSNWSEEQKKGLKDFCFFGKGYPQGTDFEIIDVPFPAVDPLASTEDIEKIAQDIIDNIVSFNVVWQVVMVQGEFTLTYHLVKKLLDLGKVPVNATTKRVAVEKDGVKTSIFKFCKFRAYDMPKEVL